VSDFVLTPAERLLLEALNRLGVRFLIVGMGAALLEGAPGTTQIWTSGSGFALQPPAIGGEGLDRVDLVLTASGLESFEQEYERSTDYELDGVKARVLPLERVLVSKRAASRAKDLAQVPMLEAALAARQTRS
jgi:hypothetical protein